MRVQEFKNGDIDELLLEDCEISLQRVGIAIYELSFSSVDESQIIQIWTTQKGCLGVLTSNELPSWLSASFKDKQIEQMKSSMCSVHLENCNKGLYILSLSSGDESILVEFSSQGYLKARFKGKSEANS